MVVIKLATVCRLRILSIMSEAEVMHLVALNIVVQLVLGLLVISRIYGMIQCILRRISIST